MPIPHKPNLPRLFGSSEADQELNRRATSIKVEWDSVTNASDYEININNTLYLTQSNSHKFTALTDNHRYDIKIRAINNDGASDWSDVFKTITRPQSPMAPERLPYDVYGWGLGWKWNLLVQADIQLKLLRKVDTEITLLADALAFESEYVDVDYPYHETKHYFLQLYLPRAKVPEDVLGSDNNSYYGDQRTAVYPHAYIPEVPETNPITLEEVKTWNVYQSLNLLGNAYDIRSF